MKTKGILLKSAHLTQTGQITSIPYISNCAFMIELD